MNRDHYRVWRDTDDTFVIGRDVAGGGQLLVARLSLEELRELMTAMTTVLRRTKEKVSC